MSLFSTPAKAALAQSGMRAALGVALNFVSGTERLLRGSENRTDPDGHVWKAIGNLGQISGLSFGVGRRTEAASIVLSGLDGTFAAKATGQAAELRGRTAEFFLHFFAADWSYLEAPTSLGIYKMDRLTVSYDGDRQLASLNLALEPLTATRFRAPTAYLDNRDQQLRYSGDTGLALIGKYVVQQTILWGQVG